MLRSLVLCLALAIFSLAARGALAETILEDNFKGVEVMMPDGQSKLYPDPRTWAFTFWPGVKWPDSYGDGTNWLEGNDESQTYVTPRLHKVKRIPIAADLRYDPFTIGDDGLHIKASLLTPEQQAAYKVGGHRRFGSGMIKSNQTFKYGSIRMVAKLPAARGSWPAMWLLPAIPKWPPEIDVFEAMAWGPHKQQLHSGLIVPRGEEGNYGDWFDIDANPSEGFHEYGLDWNKDTITATFDGKPLWQKPTPASMHQEMYLIVNFAVGGKWVYNELGIKPIDDRSPERLNRGSDLIEADYPAEMIIKSIIVEQK